MSDAFPAHMARVHRQPARIHARAPPCLNLHALGEQWIGEVSDVDVVQTPQEDSHDGDQLIFKAHIRGWETDVRRTRCQFLMEKSDHILRRALLTPEWKDVLLIPQHWYPAQTPKYEQRKRRSMAAQALTKVTFGVQRGYTDRNGCTITGVLRKVIV